MKYTYVVVLLFVTFSGFSQQNHFLYIQADNRQPFYIRMDKRLMSSSTAGYLIIPKIQDSVVQLTIGFPKNQWPEQRIKCNINQTDEGYLLKNFGEKGWGLFNFQSMALLMADTAKIEELAENKVKINSDFAGVLAQVVEDPNLREPSVISMETEPEVKPVKINRKETWVGGNEPCGGADSVSCFSPRYAGAERKTHETTQI